jgi:eukaryotic-like serine/threonine-protein kinase
VKHEPTESFEQQLPTGEQHTKVHGSPSFPPTLESPNTSHRDSLSSKIPGYKFIKRLGRGGMGVVWLCQDVKAGRLVALKHLIRDEPTSNDRTRFTTEVQAMAKLKHPNIVPVYDVDEIDDRPYFTMEYCPCGALSEYLDRTPQPAKVAARIIEQLALGIGHAHENSIIHRDLKPGNVLVSSPLLGPLTDAESDSSMLHEVRQGIFQSGLSTNSIQLKLTDFGLAKNIDAIHQMTHTQVVFGSPSYMAPEQTSSARQSGPCADIWSLGVILYECITGSLPFVGAGQLELMDNIRSKEVVPPSEKVKCPRDLETICLKCLRKDPQDRFQSAQALAADLRAFQEERSISARPMSRYEKSAKWVKKNPSWAAMISMLVLTLLSGTSVSLYYAERSAKNAEVANQLAEMEKERSDELASALIDLSKEQEKTEGSLSQNRILLAEATFNGEGTAQRANELLDAIPEQMRGWEWGHLKRRYRGSIATLYGHSDSVTSVCFAPDGSRLVSGSLDTTIRVWDAKIGTSLLELRGHSGPVNSVRVSPDSSQVVSGSTDGTIRIWDLRSGVSLREIKGHADSVQSVDISPDGKRIISGSEDKTIRIWDLKTGQILDELKGHTEGVTETAFSPDGSLIVSGSRDMMIIIWDRKTGTKLTELKGESYAEMHFGLSPDGNFIVSCSFGAESDNGLIRIWDAKTRQMLNEFKGHSHRVTTTHISSDGLRIASGSVDNSIRIWDAKTTQRLLELKGHTNEVTTVCFSPDGGRIASGSKDHTIQIWDAKSGTNFIQLDGHNFGIRSVAISPDGNRIVSGSKGNTIVWSLATGHKLLEFDEAGESVNCVGYSPDGSLILTGSEGAIRIWDASSGRKLLNLEGPEFRVTSVSFSHDGNRFVTGSADKKVRIRDTNSGEKLLELTGHDDWLSCVQFSPQGDRIASGSWDLTIQLWETQTGRKLHQLKGHTHWVRTLSFSPDGTRIASGSEDKTIRVWDTGSGKSLFELKGHTKGVNSICFSPDGSRIMSGSSDNTIRVWDAHTGQSLIELRGHTDAVTSVCFSPDGSRLVSSSQDKNIRVWDSRTFQIKAESITSEVLNYRLCKSRCTPTWHRQQLEAAEKTKDVFAIGLQNYLLHKAIAEEHLEYQRWEQAFWWFVASAALKARATVIDWTVPPRKNDKSLELIDQ